MDTTLQQYVATLEATIARWSMHQSFGIPRRFVLDDRWPTVQPDAYWLIVLDLDGLNALNHQYTQRGVDQRIHATFQALRSQVRHGDQLYQWDGGDMFCWLLPRTAEMDGLRWRVDPVAAAERLQVLLRANDLSASFAIVTPEPDIEASVTRAEVLFKTARGGARGQGQRGVIVMEAQP